MRLQLPFGIASISGKVGNVVFYSRNGKQYARRLNRHTASVEALSSECRAIIEPLSGVITSSLGVPNVTAGYGGESGGDSAPHAAKRHQ